MLPDHIPDVGCRKHLILPDFLLLTGYLRKTCGQILIIFPGWMDEDLTFGNDLISKVAAEWIDLDR